MDTKHWMKNLSETAIKLPLNYLAIPGSHDSFTCQIEPTAYIGPDVRPGAYKFMNYSGYYGKCFMKNWVITQNMDASAQLNLGIRYFDLRIGKCDTKLHITHQLFSGPLKNYLRDIAQFLEHHTKEVVLLDFNHIYLEEDDQQMLTSLIIEVFGLKVAPFKTYSQIPSLQDLWSHNHQVLVFFHTDLVCPVEFWPGSWIPTFWPNTTEVGPMIEYLKEAIKEKQSDKFHISQGILTPVFRTLAMHPFSCLRHHLADRATSALVLWLKETPDQMEAINIVIADFVQDHNFVETILDLNSTK